MMTLAVLQLLNGVMYAINLVSNIRILICSVFNSVMFLANSVIISFSCHMVVVNAKKISSTCYKILENDNMNVDIKNELLILANYTKNEQPEFTAAGFFTINRNTLCSLFSTTITYFIVALQLNNCK
ncbi:uncharacterized protein LOC126266446 [Aethina tumida]|uniref:uncharacterized protein LOC126266446 n=1 Tax=Aethina tumida TaxID=116153 RepID=UPI00214745A1|nr:uncharacterized protein LOC126266446 [Aethina tumida]